MMAATVDDTVNWLANLASQLLFDHLSRRKFWLYFCLALLYGSGYASDLGIGRRSYRLTFLFDRFTRVIKSSMQNCEGNFGSYVLNSMWWFVRWCRLSVGSWGLATKVIVDSLPRQKYSFDNFCRREFFFDNFCRRNTFLRQKLSKKEIVVNNYEVKDCTGIFHDINKFSVISAEWTDSLQ